MVHYENEGAALELASHWNNDNFTSRTSSNVDVTVGLQSEKNGVGEIQ